MKKVISILLAVWMLTAALGGTLCVGAEAEPCITVYVTIADETGSLVLAAKPVRVSYISDGENEPTATLNEVLYRAHEQYYPGGAQAGYASSETAYGLSLNRLWGVENGGAYGYYVNHQSAMSLNDPVAPGDYVAAFVYTDTASWSDTYCFFDRDAVTVYAPEQVTLTLKAASWDGKPTPVAGAAITVDGMATDSCTDEAGRVTLKLPVGENHTVSAVSQNQILVPPVCTVHVLKPAEISDRATDTAVPVVFALMAAALLGYGITDLILTVHEKRWH